MVKVVPSRNRSAKDSKNKTIGFVIDKAPRQDPVAVLQSSSPNPARVRLLDAPQNTLGNLLWERLRIHLDILNFCIAIMRAAQLPLAREAFPLSIGFLVEVLPTKRVSVLTIWLPEVLVDHLRTFTDSRSIPNAAMIPSSRPAKFQSLGLRSARASVTKSLCSFATTPRSRRRSLSICLKVAIRKACPFRRPR